MGNVDISSIEKLQSFVDAVDGELKDLRNVPVDLSGFGGPDQTGTISRFNEYDRQRSADYQFGKFMHACQRRDKQTIHEMGGMGSKWNPASQDFIKADLGTPLTGDASGTDAQYLVPQIIYEETIARYLNSVSQVIPAFQRVTMRNRLHRVAVEGTAFQLTYVTNEVTDKTEQNPTWTNVDLECETSTMQAFPIGNGRVIKTAKSGKAKAQAMLILSKAQAMCRDFTRSILMNLITLLVSSQDKEKVHTLLKNRGFVLQAGSGLQMSSWKILTPILEAS